MADTLLLSRREVARLLNISLRQVDRLLASKALPTRHIGRAVRIHRDHVESFARPGRESDGQFERGSKEAVAV